MSRLPHPGRSALPAAVVLLLAPLAAQAQESRKYLTLQGIPSATVAPSGLGFAHLSGTTGNHNDTTDGALAFGVGFGDAETGLGAQATLHVTSLKDDFADSGHLSLKFSRALTSQLYLGLEVEHLAGWGEASDIDPNASVMLSWFSDVSVGGDSYPVTVTAGYGERVRWDQTRARAGGFIGVGVGLSDRVAVSAAWAGDDWTLGLGAQIAPGLTIAASVEDAFDQNDAQRFVLAATWQFDLFGRQ